MCFHGGATSVVDALVSAPVQRVLAIRIDIRAISIEVQLVIDPRGLDDSFDIVSGFPVVDAVTETPFTPVALDKCARLFAARQWVDAFAPLQIHLLILGHGGVMIGLRVGG